jgi:conjugal transfer mating pair stabilization protein TraN
MKISLAILVLLFSGLAFADANSDAYKAGSSFGKGSASQGTSALKNTDAVSSAIPGYTSNPSEKNYYGGVTGGDSGLSDKGQSALQGSNAGQAVIDASTKNPSPVIDPNAPFITAGKAAESGSESVLNGTSQQCTSTAVSKSTLKTSSVTVTWVTSKRADEQHPLQGHMSMIMRIPLTPLILRTEN